jgi:hypothetical protein
MCDKHQVIEEPDEKKFSRPVLKESSGERFPVRLYLAVGGKRDEKTFICSIPLIFYACW